MTTRGGHAELRLPLPVEQIFAFYGRKQRERMHMIGGPAMVGASCLVSCWPLMALVGVALMFGFYLRVKRGF